MPEKIKPYKEFLKDNQQVIYSITLMIIIPGVVILNTWFFRNGLEVQLTKVCRIKQWV